MSHARPYDGDRLRKELERCDATGELPLDSRLSEVISRFDRYLQALARLRPGRTGNERTPEKREETLGGMARQPRTRGEKIGRRWPAA